MKYSTLRQTAGRLLGCALLLTALNALAAPFEEGLAAHRAGDLERAQSIWEQGADQGDARAMFSLGTLYATGSGVVRDPAAAYGWFRRAGESGLPQAQYNVGLMLDQGHGVARDPAAALDWYRQAAESGLAEAQMTLAGRLFDGDVARRDPDEAMRWYRRAAAQDYLPAALRLAEILEARRLPDEAFGLIKQFASRGHAAALNNLGVMHENGIGTPRDPVEARRSYLAAAERGLGHAQLNLARLYHEGIGGDRDPTLAAYWQAQAQRAKGSRPAATATAEIPAATAVAESRATTASLPPKRPDPRPAGRDWFDRVPADHYTVQLIGSRDPKATEHFIEQQAITDRALLLQTMHGGKPWFMVVYGTFASYKEAQAALNRLPAATRAGGPWIRKVGEVRATATGN